MTDLLNHGLVVSALGIGLTFAALGLFILVIVLLQRLFRARQPRAEEPEEAPAPSAPARDSEAQEIAAAIAIALSHLRSLEICESGLGQALEAGRGPWWRLITSGRLSTGERPSISGRATPAPAQGNGRQGS